MKDVFKSLWQELLNQLGRKQTLKGKLTISRYAHTRMGKFGLTTDDINDAWIYGKRLGDGMIVRPYYGTVLIVAVDGDENIVTDCWKRKAEWMKPKVYKQ